MGSYLPLFLVPGPPSRRLHLHSLERMWRREMECYLHPLQVVFGSVLFFILFVISTPFALLGSCYGRLCRPYAGRSSIIIRSRSFPWWIATLDGRKRGKSVFGFLTGNLCFLPDGIALFNNLGHTQKRRGVHR